MGRLQWSRSDWIAAKIGILYALAPHNGTGFFGKEDEDEAVNDNNPVFVSLFCRGTRQLHSIRAASPIGTDN